MIVQFFRTSLGMWLAYLSLAVGEEAKVCFNTSINENLKHGIFEAGSEIVPSAYSVCKLSYKFFPSEVFEPNLFNGIDVNFFPSHPAMNARTTVFC